MSVDHKSTIDANRNDLLDVLRVDELLLTELCGEDVLDQRTKQEILAGGIQHEINGRFLDWLKQSQPSTFTVCLEKLRGDQQNHIANLLEGTPGERPLTRKQRQQIQKNIRHLSEVIDVDSGLLLHMCSNRAISPREQRKVNSELTEDKAMKLLQLILQKSDQTLQCFIEALRETNQAHVISALEKGNIIELHAEFRSASDLLDQFEEELVNILNPLAQQFSNLDNEEDPLEEEVELIKEGLHEICRKRIKFLKLKKGKSINIYLWCEDVEAMAELLLMFETRHLEHILERIFNLVKTSIKIPNVMIRVTLAANDLQILKQAVQLNELAPNRSQLAEKDSCPEDREGDELYQLKPQIKIEAKAELDMIRPTVELQMKRPAHDPEEIEPKIKGVELLDAKMVESENIRLKEKLESVEQENSKLKQRLQLTQNDNAVLRKQLEKAKDYDGEVLKQETEQQCGQFALLIRHKLNLKNNAVFGVTYLRGIIYLLSTQKILAYQRNIPCLRNLQKDIPIAEIKGAADIAACHETSSLYVTDQETSCVWQIIVDELKASKWLLEVGEPFTLSVTKDGRVLIPRSEPEPCLDVYNSRADLINHFLLPGKSWQPLHAVETMNGNFIVSFWNGDIMDEYGICELNGKGQVIRRPVYDRVGLESPVYMAPGDDNWVFVARPDIDSVTLFDKQFSCDVITDEKDGIEYPQRLCYIREQADDCARLVIIYGEKSEVAIFILPNAWHCLLKNWQLV